MQSFPRPRESIQQVTATVPNPDWVPRWRWNDSGGRGHHLAETIDEKIDRAKFTPLAFCGSGL